MKTDLRPLDPVRSIKAKLALLVGASILVSTASSWYLLLYLGITPKYAVALCVLAGLAITQLLARGMTRPLRQMTSAAEAMAAGRSPGPISTSSRDEVGELARAFNAMSADLAAADTQRRDLLANVAHELRSPVAALRVQVENLVDGVTPADPQTLGDALHQVERLSQLLDDLLGLARAEAGVTPLRREPVNVLRLAEAVVTEAVGLRPDRRVRVLAAPETTADLDPARFRQVLANLVDNACRHAGPDGNVLVELRDDGDGLVLEVSDDGPGIPVEQWRTVFDRFRHGAVATPGTGPDEGAEPHPPTAGPEPTGGTGLGLAIARWAVQLHGGSIEVAPSAQGCRIRAYVPRGHVA